MWVCPCVGSIMGDLKLGRLPRHFNPAVPHLSALRSQITLPKPPRQLDYAASLAPDLGMMGNDQVGDCADAAYFHALQVWSKNATGIEHTVPDDTAVQLYCDQAGYVRGNPATDQGSVLQLLLVYLMKTGALMPDGTRKKILGFVEVDTRNQDDLDLTTAECGGVYAGFNCPTWFSDVEAPGSTWDFAAGASPQTKDGHCIFTPGYYQNHSRKVISWGSDDYTMTEAFELQFMDEGYGIITQDFVDARNGKTPYGIPLDVWEQQMSAMKAA